MCTPEMDQILEVVTLVADPERDMSPSFLPKTTIHTKDQRHSNRAVGQIL